mmetsp:Transcript_12077/g.33943  ORF Transcript_12077/g.33943 Transcript_12077/m.33943 type:complete len:81 (-) Transcript_12077:348-590(-)
MLSTMSADIVELQRGAQAAAQAAIEQQHRHEAAEHRLLAAMTLLTEQVQQLTIPAPGQGPAPPPREPLARRRQTATPRAR